MNPLISQLTELARQVIADPKANIALTVVLAGIALIVVLLFVIAGVLLLAPRQRTTKKIIRRWVPDEIEPESIPAEQVVAEDEASPGTEGEREVASDETPKERPARGRRLVAALSALMVPLLVVGALVAAYVVTGIDRTCAETCHIGQPVIAQVHVNDHKGDARCVDCHEGPQVLGFMGNTLQRTRMALVQVGVGRPRGNAAVVQSSACLRCHELGDEPVQSKVVPVRMVHTHPLDSGATCFQCHGNVGHLGEQGRVRVSMNECIDCHNGVTASSECDACHVGLPAQAFEGTGKGSGVYSYPLVDADRPDCGGCHELEKKCDPCHTLRMPHPDTFVTGSHAKLAAWEKKESCYRCHNPRDCDTCHAPFSTGHPEIWKKDHQSAGWDAGCSCHQRQLNQDIPICVFCHDNAPTRKIAPPGAPSRYPSAPPQKAPPSGPPPVVTE